MEDNGYWLTLSGCLKRSKSISGLGSSISGIAMCHFSHCDVTECLIINHTHIKR